MTEAVRSRQLRDGHRLIQVWCSRCGVTRWTSHAARGCPCRHEDVVYRGGQ
jgi:hypothetical protein